MFGELAKHPIFPIFRRSAPVLEWFRAQVADELTPSQRELVERFKEEMSRALGVPVEAIREEPLRRWIRGITKAWVKPEYLKPPTAPARPPGRARR
jgi:hypothetical protein